MNTDSVVSIICDIAKKATKIPLAIFTKLFHRRFKKKPYLESTLEILQQFYIKLVNHSTDFGIFCRRLPQILSEMYQMPLRNYKTRLYSLCFGNSTNGYVVALGNCKRMNMIILIVQFCFRAKKNLALHMFFLNNLGKKKVMMNCQHSYDAIQLHIMGSTFL